MGVRTVGIARDVAVTCARSASGALREAFGDMSVGAVATKNVGGANARLTLSSLLAVDDSPLIPG